MRVTETAVYKGPHLYASRPMVRIQLDLEQLEHWPTNRINGFTDRLLAALPGLEDHGCSYQTHGGLVLRGRPPPPPPPPGRHHQRRPRHGGRDRGRHTHLHLLLLPICGDGGRGAGAAMRDTGARREDAAPDEEALISLEIKSRGISLPLVKAFRNAAPFCPRGCSLARMRARGPAEGARCG